MTIRLLAIASAAMLTTAASAAPIHNADWRNPAWRRPNPESIRATKALNMLERHGDGQFTNFQPDGTDFTADVTQNGQVRHVVIHPSAGTITPAAT